MRRKVLGLHLHDIETQVGVPISNLSKIENGKMTASAAVILRLAEGYRVDVVTMLEWAGLTVSNLTDHQQNMLAAFAATTPEELEFLIDVLVALRSHMR